MEVADPGGRAGPGASEDIFKACTTTVQKQSMFSVILFSFLVQKFSMNTGHIGFAN